MGKLFLSDELSIIAKQKGFNEPVISWFETGNKVVFSASEEGIEINRTGFLARPLYQQILDWFRDIHNLDVKVVRMWRYSSNVDEVRVKETFFRATVHNFTLDRDSALLFMDNGRKPFTDYYKALDIAIEEAFKLIK